MRDYLLRRLLLIIPTLFLISIIIFGLIRLVPGDAVDLMADQRGAMFDMDVEAIRKSMGLTEPIHIQYFKWAGGLLRGDFGKSLWSHRSALSRN